MNRHLQWVRCWAGRSHTQQACRHSLEVPQSHHYTTESRFIDSLSAVPHTGHAGLVFPHLRQSTWTSDEAVKGAKEARAYCQAGPLRQSHQNEVAIAMVSQLLEQQQDLESKEMQRKKWNE